MKYLSSFVLSLLLFSSVLFSQQVISKIYDPPIPYSGSVNAQWGLDYVVSITEPLGRPSGTYKASTSTIYVAVPDTNISAGKCLVILSSTDNGVNWAISGSISPAAVIPKVKMLSRTGIDSVYCAFLYGSTLYCWNIGNNNLTAFTAYTNIRDFDVSMSSTGSVYTIIDLNSNNDVRIYGTTNGGILWGGAIYLSSTGARPLLSMAGTGDTALINYCSPVVADTLTSAIRSVRYRESAPGTLTLVGTFSTPVAAGTTHDQFVGVRYGPNAWLFYTSGVTGGIDLNCMLSVDGGTNYGAPFTIGSLPGRDEYWFDAKWFSTGGGVDLIYYSDTLQPGAPTNATDRMYHCYATNSNPSTFSSPVQFSDFPPGWSARGYIPTVIEYNNAGVDLGAIWVGQTGANKKLYFDRFLAVV